MTNACPHCGQTIRTMFGIRLTEHQVQILSIIEKSRNGIEMTNLARVIYPGVLEKTAKRRLSARICQINSMLVSTDRRIVNPLGQGSWGAFYRLEEIKTRRAA